VTRRIEADYGETYLFPPALEDWVGADHPARFIRGVVEELDLVELGLRQRGQRGEDEGQGGPHYSDELLLKAWLYGYLNNLRSPRQLEKACRDNVGLIWLLGRHEPDHNTLWRFWRRHRAGIRGVFRQVVRIASQAQVVGAVLHAVDGTKIQSRASTRRSKRRNRQQLAKQEQEIEAWIEQIEAEVESHEPVKGEPSGRLPESLQEAKKLRRTIREAIRALEEQDRQDVNLSEPEARTMRCEGGKRLAYNAQSVVDETSGLIVAQGVSQETTDHFQFLPMLEQTRENVGQTAADTVADQGYRSDRNIGQAEAQGDSVLVQLFEREGEGAEAYHGSRFEYDPHTHGCRCPRGERLVWKGWHKSRHGWMERRYHCDGFRQCPVAKQCSPGQRGRQIFIGPYRGAVDEQRRRQSQSAEKDKLKRRKVIVEPVFAQIKHNMGFRRWTMWGLEGVQAQWAMLCTTHNLKKLLRLWQEGKLEFATG
jgi:transposase